MCSWTRSRAVYAALALLTIGLGLFSRSSLFETVEFVRLYVGDALWALTAYWMICLIAPNWSSLGKALIAIVFAFTIEFLQLYQSPWINELRRTTIGGLILGYGFKLSDLVAYSIGVAGGVAIDTALPSSRDRG